MAADYKNRNTRPRKRKGAPGWVWFAAGLLTGLFAAFLFYLKGAPMLSTGGDPVPVTASAPVREPSRDADSDRTKSKTKAAAAPATEPRPAPPRFEFYEMLPDMEVPVNDVEVDPIRNRDADGTNQYLLQVASFHSQEDADRLRARLTLQGLDTQIQRVVIDGKNTYYRVRTGPYARLSDMERARDQLRGQGLPPIPLKIPVP